MIFGEDLKNESNKPKNTCDYCQEKKERFRVSHSFLVKRLIFYHHEFQNLKTIKDCSK